MGKLNRAATLLVGGALLLALLGCRQLSPEEQIERQRSLYAAKINSITIEAAEVEAVIDEDAASDAEVAAGELVVDTEAGAPARARVVLDILISTEAMEKLPGVTLDFSHAAASDAEKEHRLLWVDTSTLERGPGQQIIEVLEGIAYEEGDGFHVEVRSPIPAAERAKYREFAGVL